MYYEYFGLTDDEYATFLEYKKEIERGNVSWQTLLPNVLKRPVGATYGRSYDININLVDELLDKDDRFLYDDGIFYFHLIYDGKHYAAIPRLEINKNGQKEYPYRKLPEVSIKKVTYKGEELTLGWVKEVKKEDIKRIEV